MAFTNPQKKWFPLVLLAVGLVSSVLISQSSEIFYDSLLLPSLGALSYYLLNNKTWIAGLALFVLSAIYNFVFVIQQSGLNFIDSLVSSSAWALIFVGFFLAGYIVAYLISYALEKRKVVGLIAGTGGIALAIAILVFAGQMLGNPVSQYMATNAAKKHIEKYFSGEDFQIEYTHYEFKTTNYAVGVKSKSNIDRHFYIEYDCFGNYKSDTSAGMEDGSRTFARINGDYSLKVNTALEEIAGKLKESGFEIDYGFGMLLTEDDNAHRVKMPALIDIASLESGKIYDVTELGKIYGHITISVKTDEPTVKNAASALLLLKSRLDEKDVGFRTVDFTIYSTDDAFNKTYYVDIFYSQIKSDKIEDTLVKIEEDTTEFFKKMDEEKSPKDMD